MGALGLPRGRGHHKPDDHASGFLPSFLPSFPLSLPPYLSARETKCSSRCRGGTGTGKATSEGGRTTGKIMLFSAVKMTWPRWFLSSQQNEKTLFWGGEGEGEEGGRK